MSVVGNRFNRQLRSEEKRQRGSWPARAAVKTFSPRSVNDEDINSEEKKCQSRTRPLLLAKISSPLRRLRFTFLAALQLVVAVMLATGVVPIPFSKQAKAMQRLWGTVNVVVMVLALATVYFLLARCLHRCTRFVWRIAVVAFLANLGMAILTMIAQSGPNSVVTGCLCFAGIVSVWRERNAVEEYHLA